MWVTRREPPSHVAGCHGVFATVPLAPATPGHGSGGGLFYHTLDDLSPVARPTEPDRGKNKGNRTEKDTKRRKRTKEKYIVRRARPAFLSLLINLPSSVLSSPLLPGSRRNHSLYPRAYYARRKALPEHRTSTAQPESAASSIAILFYMACVWLAHAGHLRRGGTWTAVRRGRNPSTCHASLLHTTPFLLTLV